MADNNNLTGTSGHELEGVNVQDLKAVLIKTGNKGLLNECICSTAGGTAAKVTNTTPPSFSLVSGAKIIVKFTYAITVANATLQVGSTAAKPIYFRGAPLDANVVKAGTTLFLSYDGTSYNIVGGMGQNYEGGDGIDITNGTIAVDDSVARLGEDDGSALIPDIYPAVFTGTCSTAASTVAKELSINAYELVRHGAVAITFTNGISVASATLNISSKGAKALYYRGAALGANVVKAGDIVTMSYDGTNYVITSIESIPTYEHIYVAVANPTGNPMTQGWYELSNGEYVLSEDTSVDSEKTYYTQSNYYSMTI